ncbi:MAG TPA: S53 family peptidase [Gaiellales bacterium]|nr:S53 family peptidase [Gaiellales bacterium]
MASCGLAAVVAAGGVAKATGASSHAVALRGSAPAWTAHAAVRPAKASGRVSLRVYLAPRGGLAALRAAVAAVATPGSATYHRFLTPAQYRAKFEPTAAAVSSVSSWLRSAGLHVTAVEASHRYVNASGSVAAAEKAFGRKLNIYVHHGRLVRGPAGNARVPAAVAGSVLGVTGLSTPNASRVQIGPPPAGFRNARPCSKSYGTIKATSLPKFRGKHRDFAVCGYTPKQFRGAYGVSATGLTGRGTSIGIVDAFAAGTIRKDANIYSRRHGDQPFHGRQFSQVLPSSFALHPNQCQTPADWSGEETLDVEAAHGLATKANVIYYGAKSCLNQDLQDALARVDDQNKVSVVSNSYGGPMSGETSGDIAAQEQVVLQGEMQGITFLFSSGDNGDWQALEGFKDTDYPASDPFVTAVGGTSTAIGHKNKLLWQTGWGTEKFNLSDNGKGWVPYAPNPFLYGAGGGISPVFPRPSYQNGVVSANGRGYPDVALDADPTTGMLVGQTQIFPKGTFYGEYRIGGTSLASPLMAGIVADAAQHAKSRLGFLNPAIYKMAKAHFGAFRDVGSIPGANIRPDFANGLNKADGILYSVRTFDQDSSLTTGPGWDDVTGVGSPNAVFLKAFSSGGGA